MVIVSCCRTTDLGFLASRRRLNVTITRARHHLVILGSAPALLTDGAWSALLEEAQPLPSTFYSDRPASHALTALGASEGGASEGGASEGGASEGGASQGGASEGGASEVGETGGTATGTPVGREVDLLALEDSDDDDDEVRGGAGSVETSVGSSGDVGGAGDTGGAGGAGDADAAAAEWDAEADAGLSHLLEWDL